MMYKIVYLKEDINLHQKKIYIRKKFIQRRNSVHKSSVFIGTPFPLNQSEKCLLMFKQNAKLFSLNNHILKIRCSQTFGKV
jgi:hypothetical protein